MFNNKMNAVLMACVAMILCLGFTAPVAHASIIVSYNQNLTNPLGFYNGTGGVNGDFTVTTADFGALGKLMLAVRFGQYQIGPIVPGSENNYTCPVGGNCNIEWDAFMTGGLTMASFNWNFIISDTTTGHNINFDPSGFDDSYLTPGLTKTLTYASSNVGFENSERINFPFISGPLGYNPGDNLTVDFIGVPTFTGPDPDVVGHLQTQAAAVPEPSTFMLFGMGFIVFGVVLKRRSSKQ